MNDSNEDYSISNYDLLKDENWQLKEEAKWATEVTGELVKERDTLRKQLDEVRKLLNGIERGVLLSADDEAVDRWLEETK